MSHLGLPGTCHLCGERLTLHPSELEVVEGFKLQLIDVTRTDEDDLEDADAEEYTEPEDLELLGTFCEACGPKVKFGFEKWLMSRVDAKRKVAEKLDDMLGGDDAPEA